MSSTITQISASIDVNYPYPNIDNDSQGFRTNFSKIQNSLQIANDEISNIQLNAVLANQTNDFNDNIIKKANLQDCSTVIYDLTGTTNTGNIEIDYSNGSYQKFKINAGTHVFTVVNWPGTGKSGSIIISVTPDSASATYINFYANNVYNVGDGKLPVKTTSTNPEFFELWNDGVTGDLYIRHISTRNKLRAPLALESYTTATLTTLSGVVDGSIVFVTGVGYNKPAWYYNGSWYTISGTIIS